MINSEKIKSDEAASESNLLCNINVKKFKCAKRMKAVNIPRGKPESNRPWKTLKTRFSSVKNTRPRLSLEKKVELRNELRAIKEKSKELKEASRQAALAKHQRRIENVERRLANERRAEIVQVIKNPSKLKGIRKKLMRLIQKRDLSEVKVV